MRPRAWSAPTPEKVSKETRWTEAKRAGHLRFKVSMHDFRDSTGAVRVALGTARQHMLRFGYQPAEFADDLQAFEQSLKALES